MIKISPDLINFRRPTPHSKYGPSSAERWLVTDEGGCAFSVNFAEHIPSEDSVYSREGTTAHSVCEAVFRQVYYEIPFPWELQMEMVEWNSQEMMDSAHAYVDVLTYWLNNKEQIGDLLWWGLEKGIPVFPEKGCFGTGDCIIVGTKGAAVIDFKYGKGKNVSASSVQLKVYAAGLFRYIQNIPEDYRFHAVVFQPRTDPFPKETSYTPREMFDFQGVIWNSIITSERKDLMPVEGNHCFWCPAKRTKDPKLKCPLIAGKPLKVAEENFAQFLADMHAPVDNLVADNKKRDDALVKLMALAPLIAQIAKDGREELAYRMERGEKIVGIREVSEEGSREIIGDDFDDKVKMIEEKLGVVATVEVPAAPKLKTLKALEKEVGKEKVDLICQRKVKKSIEIVDDKMNELLGELSRFGNMINNGQEE